VKDEWNVPQTDYILLRFDNNEAAVRASWRLEGEDDAYIFADRIENAIASLVDLLAAADSGEL
jgi:hypothetical protein